MASAPEAWCFSLLWVQDSLLACSRKVWSSNIQVTQSWTQGPRGPSLLLKAALCWLFGHLATLKPQKICKRNVFAVSYKALCCYKEIKHLSFSSGMRSTSIIWFYQEFKPWGLQLCFPDSRCCSHLIPLPLFPLSTCKSAVLWHQAGWMLVTGQLTGIIAQAVHCTAHNTHQLAWSL